MEDHPDITNDSPTLDANLKAKTVLAIAYLRDRSAPFISDQSPTWATDATAYNLRVPVTPALVIHAQTVKHVQDAVECAVAVGLKVSARSGGHSYTSLGLGGEDGHLVVDMTRMNTISVDPSTYVATVGAGARLGDLARELFDNGERAISHGSCPAVGLSGHILHGGYGWASHSHGLALDWMVGVSVVLANGTHVHCSQAESPDLFWALRGAGSNFGIVTSYELATFAAPTVSIPFKVSLRWQNVRKKIDGVTALVNFARDMPADLNMRLMIHDSGDPSLEGIYYGSSNDLSSILGPLVEKVGGVLNMYPGTWIQGLEHYAERNSLTPSANEHGKFYATSLVLKDLCGDTLTTFVHEWHCASDTDSWFVQLDIHGGTNSAVSAIPNSETAYAHRDKLFLVQFYLHGAYDIGRRIYSFESWIGSTIATLDGGDYGMYFNYTDSEQNRRTAQKLYWADNLERLRLIKKMYDPTEVFYYPQSIEPAGSTGRYERWAGGRRKGRY